MSTVRSFKERPYSLYIITLCTSMIIVRYSNFTPIIWTLSYGFVNVFSRTTWHRLAIFLQIWGYHGLPKSGWSSHAKLNKKQSYYMYCNLWSSHQFWLPGGYMSCLLTSLVGVMRYIASSWGKGSLHLVRFSTSVIPSAIISCILQHDETIRVASGSSTSTLKFNTI